MAPPEPSNGPSLHKMATFIFWLARTMSWTAVPPGTQGVALYTFTPDPQLQYQIQLDVGDIVEILEGASVFYVPQPQNSIQPFLSAKQSAVGGTAATSRTAARSVASSPRTTSICATSRVAPSTPWSRRPPKRCVRGAAFCASTLCTFFQKTTGSA